MAKSKTKGPEASRGEAPPTEEAKREASKREAPQRASSRERSAAQNEASGMKKELEQTQHELAQARARVAQLEKEVGSLRLTTGAFKPLSAQQVAEKLKANPHQKFTVLADYKHMNMTMTRSRVMEAHLYPRLLSYVQDGLQLHAEG